MNQLEYLPGIAGQSVQLDGPSAFVGIAEEMRSREWDYDLGYRDLVTATRPARTVDVTFHADYDTADTLRRVADADVMARTPGTFVAQKEWKQRGYILASDVDDIHYGRLSTGLKIALLDGAWWRLVDKTFMPENTAPTYKSATGKSVTTVEAANVPLHALTVDGESVQDGTPTPSAPVDVQVVRTPNLIPFSIDAIKTYNTSGTWSGNTHTYRGISVTLNDNGTITVNGTATGNYTLYLVPNSNQLFLPDGSYTLTGELPGTGSDATWYFQATTTTNSSGTVKARNRDYGSGVTFAVDSTVYGVAVYFHAATGDTFNNAVLKPQLVSGSQAQPFVPYGSIGLKVGSTITPINLQGNVLASLPDGTKDVLTVDSAGHVVMEKRTKRLVFNGDSSEGWSIENSGKRVTTPAITGIASPAASSIVANILCSYTPANSATNTWNANLGTSIQARKIQVSDGTGSMTVSAWTSLLAANPMIVVCGLLTPITIDLGYIDMPTMSDGAVVSITAEVTPTITAEWQTSPDIYLDYPHNYPYDYQKTSSTGSITPSVLTPSDVYLVIYGPAVNPYVIVGGNRYQVNATVPAGGYLTVDGRKKSILLTLADGTVQNVFSSGVRGGGAGGGSYIFEKVPAGTSEVTYDGSFGFDLGWYEEEGEPPWSQS